ncbi:hypothetical protein JCM10213_007458 [Rhodosporidiobolus nylandii]
MRSASLPLPVLVSTTSQPTSLSFTTLASGIQGLMVGCWIWMGMRAGRLLPRRLKNTPTPLWAEQTAVAAPAEQSCVVPAAASEEEDWDAVELHAAEEALPSTAQGHASSVFVPYDAVKEEEALVLPDVDDEDDLPASLPPSPTPSSDSFSSRPPSPLFDTPALPSAEVFAELEAQPDDAVFSPPRSLAFPVKVALLEEWLATTSSARLLSPGALDGARAQGERFIETEERYELQYEAASGMRFDTDEARAERWKMRIQFRMEQVVEEILGGSTLPTPTRRPSHLHFTSKSANDYANDSLSSPSLPHISDDAATSTLVDLPSLRSLLDLPPTPRNSTWTPRNSALYYPMSRPSDDSGKYLARTVMQHQHWRATAAVSSWCWAAYQPAGFPRPQWATEQPVDQQKLLEGEDEQEEVVEVEDEQEDVVEADDREDEAADALLLLATFPLPPSSATKAFHIDEDDEDEDYFSSPPVFV